VNCDSTKELERGMLWVRKMAATTTTELRVTGMTCNNCARKVTVAAQAVAGVHSVSVSVSEGQASVRWQSAADQNVALVLAAIGQAGFRAAELAVAGASRQSRWQWNLVGGLGVTGVLMIGEWALGLAMTPWFQRLAFVLAGGVQVFCGAQFYSGAWRQLKVGESNMDALVALGSTTAFGYSTWALFSGAGGHVYFMEAAAIISLISFGHWIEARVSNRAGNTLKTLLNLAPQTARRLGGGAKAANTPMAAPTLRQFAVGGRSAAAPAITPSTTGLGRGGANLNLKTFSLPKTTAAERPAAVEQEVLVAELKIGDRVALRPGDRVPVDGVVVEGESAVDEAMLTGESAPADKRPDGEVFAGTVNLDGRLVMRVTATGEATALAHIVAAVQRAQTSRANIQRLGDRISSVFVPVIVLIALAAGFWWGLAPAAAGRVHDVLSQFIWHVHTPAGAAAGFIIAAAVLIIACPCAMGLATPAAIMASANTAARRGILIRDGVALEKAGTITAVIFDKTGTLTSGKSDVASAWHTDPARSAANAQLTWALARHSSHPVSQAVAALGQSSVGTHSAEVSLMDWKELRGQGIEAELQSPAGNGQSTLEKCRLGSLRWLREVGVAIPDVDAFAIDWSGQGASVVGLAQGNQLLSLFAVRDTVKPRAADVVSNLQRQNLRICLLTGDHQNTAIAIAKAVGITPENVFAEVRPEEKAGFVKQLQARGERVAFVGDGINDAPALMQADLGIAVSRASDVAREAADIILLKSDIEAVPEALGLARATLRTIKQNLFWAFFYNSLGVPLAALGFISPVFCAAAMGVSDLVVIGNALRLLRWKQR
jgi:Cu+-exporting ATPase